MKFNHSLQFNAVPEWTSKYIDYSGLKKIIYSLEQSSVSRLQGTSDNEEAALIAEHYEDPVAVFEQKLNSELEKIDVFYTEMETKLFKEFDQLIKDYDSYIVQAETEAGREQRRRSSADAYLFPANYTGNFRSADNRILGRSQQNNSDSDDDDDDDPNTELPDRRTSVDFHPEPYRVRNLSLDGPSNRHRSHSVADVATLSVPGFAILSDLLITIKKRAVNLYVSLCELRSYAQLNKTGFSKGLKKFDKTLNCQLRSRYLENTLSKTYVFSKETESLLDQKVNEAIELYSKIATDNDIELAKTELRLHLREHIVWERNTVWRDMIGMERKAHAAAVGASGRAVKLQGEADIVAPEFVTIWGVSVPAFLVSTAAIKVIAIAAVFVVFLCLPILESVEQNRCLAVVIAASMLWATEAMPLFTTSLLVPFLVISLRIPCDGTGQPMTAPDASKYIFSQMWSSVIMLLLGGFTLAAALSKFHIAKMLATGILSRAGTNPKVVLLTLMFVAAFLSMWISNVAAPVLCFSIAQPLLRTIPKGSPFAKAIVLGIALASNIGGMASPIASPQNIIALENMEPAPSWVQWFAVSIPVSVISIVLIWGLLIISFKPGKGLRVTAPIRMVDDRFTFQQAFICVVTVLTIISWCFSHQLEPYVGEMGVLALIPIVVFFGTGLLSAEDFNNFLWTIIALAMGGISLGKAVSSSGLLNTVAHGIEAHVVHGMGLYGVMTVFGIMILAVATFVSHTVAALIILPLVQSIGLRMDDPHPRLLVLAAAFLCSAAMGLPTSGFPNVTAICMTDEVGRPYLTVGNFISRGVPASVLAYLVIITLGYLIMSALGF
jgi:anion transporter